MKVLIAYSSRTTNTRQLAEAIHIALPDAELSPVTFAPNPDAYDMVFLGTWIEHGTADQAAQEYLGKIKGKPVAVFTTLGDYPDSQHAKDCLGAIKGLVSANNTLVDQFICQGAIDPALIEWMKDLPKDHGYGPTEHRQKLWKDGEGHPDGADLKAVSDWAVAALEKAKA